MTLWEIKIKLRTSSSADLYSQHIDTNMYWHSQRAIIVHYVLVIYFDVRPLKSLGPIDRKFHGHGKNDGFELHEYIIKQCSSFCKYSNISVMKKKWSKKITCQQ